MSCISILQTFKFLITPFLFLLVQKSCTFFFLYFTAIHFAFLNNVTNLIDHYIVIFFLTYCYLGLKFTAIEIDDLFRDDDGNFNNIRLCCFSFEDIYPKKVGIYGEKWADKLHKRFNGGKLSKDLPIETKQWLRKLVKV